jgi:hypothetical protein
MVPTLQCNGLPTQDRRQSIANAVISISGDDPFDDAGSPVWLAFTWLVNDDQYYVCPEDESLAQRYALAVLYFATDGDNWMKCRRDGLAPCTDQDFLSEYSECLWGGITCDAFGRVQKINLDDANLKGSLPDELSVLAHVEELDFDSNVLRGHLPNWFGSLKHLERLDLDRNNLSGTIPEDIYDSTSLKFFDIDRNILSGTISTKIGSMEQLTFFQVDYNQMTGNIPTEVGALSKLQYFSIFGNEFDDKIGIPEEVCGNYIQIYANCNMCDNVGDCCTICLPQT